MYTLKTLYEDNDTRTSLKLRSRTNNNNGQFAVRGWYFVHPSSSGKYCLTDVDTVQNIRNITNCFMQLGTQTTNYKNSYK